MIPLVLYLLHSFAGMALFGVWGSRQFGWLPWVLEDPRSRQADFLAATRRTRLFTGLLVLLEGAAGAALMVLPNWRASGFLWAVVLMVLGWILTAGWRLFLSHHFSDPAACRKLWRFGWLCGANYAARAVILILVGTV